MSHTSSNGQRKSPPEPKKKPDMFDAAFEGATVAQLLVDECGAVAACNASARQLLTTVADYVPVETSTLVGEPVGTLGFIEIADDDSVSTEQLGDTILEIRVAALGDGRSHLISLNDITNQRIEAEWAERYHSMVRSAPTNMMFADKDLVLRCVNDASRETLRSLGDAAPVPVDEIEGSLIDLFHEYPDSKRALLADPANLPHHAIIDVGDEKLELLVTAIHDSSGEHIGSMATWDVVTQRLAILDVIEAAATGDLSQSVSLEGDDVFAQMADALGRMFATMGQSVIELIATSAALAESSEQVNLLSTSMGSTAQQTSAQAGIVAAAAEQVSANVSTVASATEQMSASIKEIASNSSTAAQVAGQAVEVARETSQTVTKLGESSTEIGQIIKVITTIAQQTNLLALNATIEAARAGEAGKGFAVVANEVKDLAKETARATEDISQKIETIQGDTTRVTESIARISEIVDEIADIQSAIAGAVEEQALTTGDIGRNVAEAARGSSEIAENITSVATAAESTTASALQTSQAGDELAKMASELRALVSAFTY